MQSVIDGNRAAQASAFLMTVAFVRGVDAVLESPHDSRMFAFFHHAAILRFCNIRSSCMRCAFDVEPDGERIWKRYIFMSFCSWAKRLRHGCRCLSNTHTKTTKKRFGRTTGMPGLLKRGGAYPPALGTEVISAWELGEASDPSGSPQKHRRRRRLAKQVYAASLASSSSQLLFSDSIEDDGGLVFEDDAGFSALSSEVVCSGSAADMNGAGLTACSPGLDCGSSVDSNGADLAAPSPSLCCGDSNDDVEQGSCHLDSMSEPGLEFSGSE